MSLPTSDEDLPDMTMVELVESIIGPIDAIGMPIHTPMTPSTPAEYTPQLLRNFPLVPHAPFEMSLGLKALLNDDFTAILIDAFTPPVDSLGGFVPSLDKFALTRIPEPASSGSFLPSIVEVREMALMVPPTYHLSASANGPAEDWPIMAKFDSAHSPTHANRSRSQPDAPAGRKLLDTPPRAFTPSGGQCDVCGKVFTLKKNWQRHMLMHDTSIKKFKCTWYVSPFPAPSQLPHALRLLAHSFDPPPPPTHTHTHTHSHTATQPHSHTHHSHTYTDTPCDTCISGCLLELCYVLTDTLHLPLSHSCVT
jgi:hypothetical protein